MAPSHDEEAPRADTDSDARRVLIAGGGYAGVTLAVKLGKALAKRSRTDVEIVLVEPNPCQQALSELDLVAVGPERPEFCELWLPAVLKGLPVRTCFDRVQGIDLAKRVVYTGDGHEVPYWRVAVCTGAVPSLPPVPGLAERAVTMWSVADAQELQRRVNDQMRAAARMPSAQDRRRALTFVVCGGGATGVEIIGTMGQLLPKRAEEIGLGREELSISLVEGRPQILYDLREEQRAKATARLEKLGVRVVTGSMVSHVTEDAVVLQDGRDVPASVLVWAGGAKADPHAADWGFEMDNANRLIAEADLKAKGHDDAYVLGDVAAFKHPETGRTLPMLAQYAIREAEHTADNILRELDGLPTEPFQPHMHGEFVSVGPSWGIGWALNMQLSGIPAIFMKRLTYVMYWWQVGGLRLAWSRTRELLAMQR
ncbi:MAG: NAD(P)/FAD-dependent oxidoreductase [Coriobacteriia bacterium]|nr:NAD(P)/FAD-dependent oxidoreductase [Coriobacteriia bacterium]